MRWRLSSSSDPEALAIVDGTNGEGPHYSRRTPGSKTFTGCGQEVVLVTDSAVWAVVRQRTPAPRGSGASRGRDGASQGTPFVFRNMIFRNLGSERSSDLIAEATERTYFEWRQRYGEVPTERLRTEVDVKRVRSTNPGFCYLMAGWERGPLKGTKRHLYAPPR